MWVQYINNILITWTHTREKLDHFLWDLNKQKERIKFTVEIMTQSCNFLDLAIDESAQFFRTGRLSVKIYYKPTNTFATLAGHHMYLNISWRAFAVGEATGRLWNTEWLALYKHCIKNPEELKTRIIPERHHNPSRCHKAIKHPWPQSQDRNVWR